MTTWERRTQIPLLILALVFLVAYAWPILDPGLDRTLHTFLDVVQLAVWAIFGVDYLVRLWLAPRKWRFVRVNLFDLAFLVLPVLRPLRALRLLVLLRQFNRTAETNLRGRAVAYVAVGVLTICVVGALAALDVERLDPRANIFTFGDAIWWAAETVTTVGYGDHYPVTTEGRLVAVGLMVSGIGLLGTVTASLASWFTERVRQDREATLSLEAEVKALSEKIDILTGQGGQTSSAATYTQEVLPDTNVTDTRT